MIVADSSALVAILRLEMETDRFIEIILRSGGLLVSSVSYLETSLVLAGRFGDRSDWDPLDTLLRDQNAEIVPHDAELTIAARDAFLRFGKGRHPAGLNMGDCAAYALAKSRNLPLLFKGGDFALTDVVAAD